MKPPFEIYHEGVHIADADGHICTAENPEIAEAILAALNRATDIEAVAAMVEAMPLVRYKVRDSYDNTAYPDEMGEPTRKMIAERIRALTSAMPGAATDGR